MWVPRLALQDFRNFTSLQTPLDNGINIVCGDNAQGKTNLLEAVFFCATGRSQRAGSDRELLRFGCREAHLQTEFQDTQTRVIDVHILQNDKTTQKGIAVDHIPIKKLNELFGLLLVVVFSPEDLRLIKAGPAERRVYVDMALCQLSAVYHHELRQYHHALKQRNNLLKAIQKDRSLSDTVSVWDEQLTRYGRRVMVFRTDFIQQLDRIAQNIHSQMTGGTERLTLSYRPSVVNPDDYDEKLRRGLERDLALGYTSAGIHRDDVQFNVNGTEARVYGSQGQQRTAALSAKLAEIDIIRENKKTTPVLLLDDVLSELDEQRQTFLLKNIGPLQTILTCTGVEDILKKNALQSSIRIMRMKNGVIE